jgi:uncharacterized protein YceK
MKNFVLAFAVIAIIIGCSATKSTVQNLDKKQVAKNDTVRIANDSLEYEVIIIDPGFSTWLASTAKPRNYYSLTSMEIKNTLWVSEWNRRVLEPHRYDPNLYEMRIDYDSNIHYGYEVNYLIYNYFLYFQQQYRQKL